MKRYLFLPIPVIALFAGAAFAQDPAETGNSVAVGNESVVEQIGSSNAVSADQSKIGANSGNYPEVYQGLNNNASSGNSASVQQVAAGGAKMRRAHTQDGNNNTATTLQNTNASGGGSVTFLMPAITFTNNANGTSTVPASSATQAAGSFTSTIEQSNNGNTAHVYQGAALSAATGTAYSVVKRKDAVHRDRKSARQLQQLVQGQTRHLDRYSDPNRFCRFR